MSENRAVTTASGFTCTPLRDWVNDMEFFEQLVELEQGQMRHLPAAVQRILGPEGKMALYDHLRDEKGKVPMDAVLAAVTEIITAMGDGKNS